MNYHKAFDLAVQALDERRQKFVFSKGKYEQEPKAAKHYDEINEAIRILTELKHRYGANDVERMI